MLDLSDEVVINMINARNVIEHGNLLWQDNRTKAIDPQDLFRSARELITRIILSRMGYVGHYLSFEGGQHTRSFPSCERVG